MDWISAVGLTFCILAIAMVLVGRPTGNPWDESPAHAEMMKIIERRSKQFKEKENKNNMSKTFRLFINEIEIDSNQPGMWYCWSKYNVNLEDFYNGLVEFVGFLKTDKPEEFKGKISKYGRLGIGKYLTLIGIDKMEHPIILDGNTRLQLTMEEK